ncbi:cytochrome P450 family 94 subfamily D polypeptide 2 [Citrus sinensis]|uniref:Cytochrome P450 family 94 subfamily D polypeptide 2 n=1 Tax=Citrus sinensis TaxID=2711 RepID=A0ACB8K208_CITSI|nr:cytochrome P450 family 94 subfamily D polypeptide 2 [Citrus sinensis]
MEMLLSLQSFIFISLLSLYLYLYFFTSYKRPAVGFKHYPVVGALPGYLRNRHRFLDWSTEILKHCPKGTTIFYSPGEIHSVITANPANVEHILKTNFENYPKGQRFVTLLEDFLGRGIFNSDGELWKVQRKTASYEFNTKSLRNFVMDNVRFETLSRLVPILVKASRTGQVLDLQDILERYGFDNICKVAFNFDPGCLGGDGTAGSEFMRAFEDAATLSSGRFLYAFKHMWSVKKFFNIGSERTLKNSIAIVHEFANNIIRSRMEEKTANMEDDLLSRFIGNGKNSTEFLRDIVISFILAGRDSTSSALSWFFWLLASHPKVEQNILKELESIRARNGRSVGATYSFEELRDMHYLHAALSETLRLYPPVPVDSKACRKDDILPDGTFVGKDWFVTYHAYAMGRMESIWGENCNEYLPERWLEDGIYRSENVFRFPVFHAGPRMCLGKDMAYIQMKSIAASVIERFAVDVQHKDTCPEKVLSLTLRIKDGLHVTVRERCPGAVD